MILVLDPELGPGIMNVYIFLQPAIHKGILDSFFFKTCNRYKHTSVIIFRC